MARKKKREWTATFGPRYPGISQLGGPTNRVFTIEDTEGGRIQLNQKDAVELAKFILQRTEWGYRKP